MWFISFDASVVSESRQWMRWKIAFSYWSCLPPPLHFCPIILPYIQCQMKLASQWKATFCLLFPSGTNNLMVNSPAGTDQHNKYTNAWMLVFAWKSFSRYHFVSVPHSSSTLRCSLAGGLRSWFVFSPRLLFLYLALFNDSLWNIYYSLYAAGPVKELEFVVALTSLLPTVWSLSHTHTQIMKHN